MRKVIKGSYGAAIMNRLKNENPQYAFIGSTFLEIMQSKFGGEARDVVRDIIAICYRLLELSERHPDQARALKNVLLADPPLSGSDEAIALAENEASELLKKLMLHHKE